MIASKWRTLSAMLLASAGCATLTSAQAQAATRQGPDVSGAVTVTNKGISTVPTFTLGKPAAIFDMSVRARGFGFEPQLRFGLDGKPCTFLFWGRYRTALGDRLLLTVGAHPALSFRTISVPTNGERRDVIVARRYLAGELNPMYALSKKLSVGSYYLYSYGVERDVTKHTHYVAGRAMMTTASPGGAYSLRVMPQIYHLRLDRREGDYLNANLTLARRSLPVSISTMMNTPIRTAITEGEALLWNVSLTFTMD